MKRLPMTEAGQFRHRIDIEQRVTVQDTSGDPIPAWVLWAANVPAAIAPLSTASRSIREAAIANGIVSRITMIMTLRYRDGIDATMRIKHHVGTATTARHDIYNIEGVLPDPETGQEYLTLLVNRGVNEG